MYIRPFDYPRDMSPHSRTAAVVSLIAVLFLALTSTTLARDQRIRVDIRTEGDTATLATMLAAADFEVELVVPDLGRWQGWIPADQIEAISQIEGVLSVGEPTYGSFAAGAALSEGDQALNAALARALYDVDGSGVHIAVISDGIVGLAQAQQTGEAPKLVDARAFGAGDLNAGQEGTVMIEIIHDLAPGASVSFAAVSTDVDHIVAVNHYAPLVDIIVDDISYAFPADQRSDVSTNTTQALERHDWRLRLYVTAAGNWGESHWSGEWLPGIDGREIGLPQRGATHEFSESTLDAPHFGAGNGFQVETDAQIRIALFWDDQWGRSTNNYNLYLLSADGDILAQAETTQGIGVNHHFPREHLVYDHDGPDSTIYVVIQNHQDDAEPVVLQLFVFSLAGLQVQLQHRVADGSILAQSDAEGAITVAAVNVGRDQVAAYSSRGPTVNGALKPDIAAVDSVTVSETTRFAPRFSGSSAAAPHVAAVGALLLESQPALTAADGGNAVLERDLIRQFLLSTAQDLPPAGPDPASGTGLIDANAALLASADRIAIVNSAADSGPGSLRAALESGAPIILCSQLPVPQTIQPSSPLPPVQPNTILDASGWTLDASNLQLGLAVGAGAQVWGLRVVSAAAVGIALRGDGASLHYVNLDSNGVGVSVEASATAIHHSQIRLSDTNGIEVNNGASLTISTSEIISNGGAGLLVHDQAGDVHVGPVSEQPQPVAASELAPPIAPFNTLLDLPRSGLDHAVQGSVLIDGLPAPAGTEVDVYLDRRLAASVAVGDHARFHATVPGPGTEIRFAVNGVTTSQRLNFTSGGHSSVRLPSAHRDSVMVVGPAMEGGNHISNNRVGIQIQPSDPDSALVQAAIRRVWGNTFGRNQVNISVDFAAPAIDDLSWNGIAFTLSGRVADAASVDLYAGSGRNREYIATTQVRDGQFRFERVIAHQSATETDLSVIGHSALNQVTAESDILRIAAPGALSYVAPKQGYAGGGDPIELCGVQIASDSDAPDIWIGGQSARVTSWSRHCVSVITPAGAIGAADIIIQRHGSRPIMAREAFTYTDERVVQLERGWNLVTWHGQDTRITAAFATLAGVPLRAYVWDADQQSWSFFATALPPQLSTLRVLRQNQPLWLYMDGPARPWRQAAGS